MHSTNDLSTQSPVIKQGITFATGYFISQTTSILGLYADQTLRFVGNSDHSKDMNIRLDDIKLANFAYAGTGTLAISTKHNKKYYF